MTSHLLHTRPSGEKRTRFNPREVDTSGLVDDDGPLWGWPSGVIDVASLRYAGSEFARRVRPDLAVHDADTALQIARAMSPQELNSHLSWCHDIDAEWDEAVVQAYLDRPDVGASIDRVWAENVRLWDEESAYLATLPDQEGPVWYGLPDYQELFVPDDEG